MILFVCWHLILNGVYFDAFDIETVHRINVTEEKKVHGPTGTRIQDISKPCKHSIQTIDPLQFLHAENRFVPDSESARNRACTNETRRDVRGGGGSRAQIKTLRRIEPRASRVPCDHSLHSMAE